MTIRPHNSHSFRREVIRSIRGSLGRFLAIMGIVALGCGFFAGLQMAGPDMRDAADRWYDGTRLWDLRIVSTLGFSNDDVARIDATPGVEVSMPAKSCDVMMSIGDAQIAARITSIDVNAALASELTGRYTVASKDARYLNRPMLREGRWPKTADECVISADAVGHFKLGDTVEVLYSTDNLNDMLAVQRFKVVGTVSASDYPYTKNFGSTTLGTGQLDEYLYVREAAFTQDLPYTQVYVRVRGAEAQLSESSAYKKAVDRVARRLEDREGELARFRQKDLILETQTKLDDKRADFDVQRADAEAKLDDAQQQLVDSYSKLEDGETEYASGKKKRDDGAAELSRKRNDARKQFAEAEKKLNEGKKQLDEKEKELLASLSKLDPAPKDLSSAKEIVANNLEQLDAGIRQLDQGIDQLKQGIDGLAQLKEALVQAQAAVSQLEQAKLQLGLAWTDEQEQQLLAAKAQLESLQTQLDALTTQLGDNPEAKLSQLETQRQQLDASRSQLTFASDGIDQLQTAKSKLQSGRDELATQKDEANKKLDAAQAKIDDASTQLSNSRTKLDDAWTKYYDGKAKYEQNRADADKKFADAENDFAEAQRKIDEIELPDLYVLNRTKSEGAATYHADAQRMDHIARVFPLMFFLVAALVSLTTMTRMVEDDRIQIGTYKALGFSTATIASKYLVYAAAASITGAIIGTLVLTQILPSVITGSYSIIYAVPELKVPLPIDPVIALFSGGLGVGVTLLATWGAVVSSLRSTPAELMLPRAPKAGKRILLERISPIWRHLSFSWKVTFRNLFRYKRRFLMTTIGIAGCTALLLVGFGLHDSIWDIIDRQFGPVVHYDTTVGLNESSTTANVDAVASYLLNSTDASHLVRARQENLQASSAFYGNKHLRTQVIIPQDAKEFDKAISFQDRLSGHNLDFSDDSVFVTEKAANLLGVSVGDEIELYKQDAIGSAVGEPQHLRVTGIAENYVGNLVYVGRASWSKIGGALTDGKDAANPVFSTIFFSRGTDTNKGKLSAGLHDLTGVATVEYVDETINTYRSMLSVVDKVVVVLIVSAAALAFIVLYNLTNINIEERKREIASLKVLGFTRREVDAYIFREIGMLVIIGDIAGLILGTFLERFVVTAAEVDYVMFGRLIHPASYGFAFGLTLLFAAAVLVMMRRKLDRVDMVESLKSVD